MTPQLTADPLSISRAAGRRRKRTISTRSLNNVVSDMERFHRRTISTSDMRDRSTRSGYLQISGDEDEAWAQHNIHPNTGYSIVSFSVMHKNIQPCIVL